MRGSRFGVIAAVVCAVMLLAGAGSATTPTKQVIEDQGIYSLGTINCHGFKLVEQTLDETVTITTYYDDAGNAIKLTIKVNFLGAIKNTKTGKTFRDHVSFTEAHDLIQGTTTITGSTFHFVDSGKGTIFTEGGKKVVVDEDGTVTFNSGPTDYTNGGDAALCDALA